MKRIGVISDTHGWLDERVLAHLSSCDEIWHAGDIGSQEVAERLTDFKPLKAVHGNIDGGIVRILYPEFLEFKCEDVVVLMTHIGGYPKHYWPAAQRRIQQTHPQLFVCGHSHILKVQYDSSYSMLCLNPGAIGLSGFHQVRTLLRFEIDGNAIKNLEVIEIPKHA